MSDYSIPYLKSGVLIGFSVSILLIFKID